MPADLRAHVRYPEDLFRVQTALFATYHMANPETFYHREDQWQIPNVPSVAAAGRDRAAAGEAFLRHMVMRLPGERDPEFILMRPFTPRQKDNLAAWMVARNDGANYGKLAVYRFPRQSLVFGPNQIVNRINQDTEVARQITLWDQRGSEVLRGELLVLPIEGALIYVQPLYLRAQGGRIPELKRVVAAHEGRVAMAGTLDGALGGPVHRRLHGGHVDGGRAGDDGGGGYDVRHARRRLYRRRTCRAAAAQLSGRRGAITIVRARRSAPMIGRRTGRKCVDLARCSGSSSRLDLHGSRCQRVEESPSVVIPSGAAVRPRSRGIAVIPVEGAPRSGRRRFLDCRSE